MPIKNISVSFKNLISYKSNKLFWKLRKKFRYGYVKFVFNFEGKKKFLQISSCKSVVPNLFDAPNP